MFHFRLMLGTLLVIRQATSLDFRLTPVLSQHECGLGADSSAGEYKVILQLVSVLSHGKLAKRLTDRAIDQMQDVQNLRKAIYEYVPLFHDLYHCARVPMGGCGRDLVALRQKRRALTHVPFLYSYKLKVSACEKGSAKQRKLMNIGINYLYVPFFTLAVCACCWRVQVADC